MILGRELAVLFQFPAFVSFSYFFVFLVSGVLILFVMSRFFTDLQTFFLTGIASAVPLVVLLVPNLGLYVLNSMPCLRRCSFSWSYTYTKTAAAAAAATTTTQQQKTTTKNNNNNNNKPASMLLVAVAHVFYYPLTLSLACPILAMSCVLSHSTSPDFLLEMLRMADISLIFVSRSFQTSFNQALYIYIPQVSQQRALGHLYPAWF